MWVADDDYPNGRRLPMTPNEQAEVDADVCDDCAATLESLDNPTQIQAFAARALAEAAQLLRLGLG